MNRFFIFVFGLGVIAAVSFMGDTLEKPETVPEMAIEVSLPNEPKEFQEEGSLPTPTRNLVPLPADTQSSFSPAEQEEQESFAANVKALREEQDLFDNIPYED